MRFLELKLKPFGRFEDETIRFSTEIHSVGGFHMIIGPNEAGKSTTLAAFERFLFGFPKKDIYNILKRKNLWIGADLQLSTGECIGLWRKNSQQNSLLGENQKDSRPANLLENLLRPIDSKTYMKLFGLNQDTLREGGKKLVSGEGEFADILFGESLGDLHRFDKIRVALKSSADELFKIDGRSRTPLNALRSKIDELNTKMQESVTRTAVWTEMELKRESIKGDLNRVEREIAALGQQLNLARNRSSSRKHVDELKRLQVELEPLAGLPRVQERLHHELTKADTRLASIKSGIQESEERIRMSREVLLGIMILQKFLDHGEEIATLSGKSSAIDQHRSRVAELTAEIEQQRFNLKNQAFELGLDFDRPEQVPRIDTATKKRIDKNGQNIKTLQAELKQADHDVNRLGRELEKLRQVTQGEVFSEFELTTVNSDLTRLRTILDQQLKLPEIKKNLSRLNSELHSKLRALPFWSGDLAEFDLIALPEKEAVESAEHALIKAATSCEAARQRWFQLKLDVQKQEQSIAKRREQLTLPSLDELLLARQERDEAWAEIDARWRQSVDLPANEKSVYSDLFSQLIKTADRMADQLRDHAELVSEMLQLEVLRAERDMAHFKHSQEMCDYQKSMGRWQNFWGFLLETPVDPLTVKSWLGIGPVVEKLKQDISEAELQLTEIHSLWPTFRDSKSGFAIAGVRLDALDAEIAFAALSEKRDLLNSRGAIEKKKLVSIEKKQDELDGLTLEIADKRASLANETTAWQEILKTNSISEVMAPDEFTTFAGALAVFHQDWQRYHSIIETRQNIVSELATFDANLHKLAENIGFREDPDSTTSTIRQMSQELGKEREKQANIVRLERDIETEQKKITRLAEARREDEEKIKEICQKISVENVGSAEERFGAISRRDAIEASINQTVSILTQLRGDIDLESWTAIVSAETADETEVAIKDCLSRLSQHEESRAELLKDLGAWSNRQAEIEKRVGQARSLDARNEHSLLVETTKSQIRNYMKYAITNRILEEAAQDYRKRMGDDVLNMASDNFRTLSLQSFDGIRQHPNESGGNSLVAVRDMNDPDSVELHLNELSEGTRDQLFMALKMAMIRNRLMERQKHGQSPLPVILDDILVQFDDDRSAAAFRLLGELSEITQVVFLTHHSHLEAVARAAFGEKQIGIHRLTCLQPAPLVLR